MRDIISINKNIIPYSFDILLGDNLWTLLVNYNTENDLFTVELYAGNELICVEPVIYGVPLFGDSYMAGKYPAIDIIPLDPSNQENAVTWDNFNETVFLAIDDEEGEDDG